MEAFFGSGLSAPPKSGGPADPAGRYAAGGRSEAGRTVKFKGETMKIFVLIVLVFTVSIGSIFAQNFPTTGTWRLQVIGTSEEFAIEINGTTWTFDANGSKLPQIVTINNEEKTIVIPLLVSVADYYFFEIKGGYIDLKAGGKFNLPLLNGISNGMTGLRGINEVSDNFVEQIVTEIELLFYKIPIMRLYQNQLIKEI
jgi:hypothetical protein